MIPRYKCRFVFDGSVDSLTPIPEPFESSPTFLPRVEDCIIHKGKRYQVYAVQYSFDLERLDEPFLVCLYDPEARRPW